MRFVRTAILPEVVVVESDVHADGRGFLVEAWNAARFREAGIHAAFVQANVVRSARGVLRGLHAQRARPQGKLVRVAHGEVFDVAVDIRRRSLTFLRWEGIVLSAENAKACWIPPGFAHGYCVTSESADIVYQCTRPYDPSDEIGIAWDDPEIGIRWPVPSPILSDKDRAAKGARETLR